MSHPTGLTGAEAVLEILRNYRIEYIFASPGSEWPPLWEQLAKQKALGQPGGYVSGLSGGLGLGMGIALGVKGAAPDKLVMALIGDGSFNYNPVLAAFGCAQEHHLPILTVLFNNQGYLSMKMGVQQLYPQGWAMKTDTFYGAPITPRPDYAALARAFAGYGETVEDPQQIRPALQRALEAVRSGKAALVDVVLAG